jgi:hypothetical protein
MKYTGGEIVEKGDRALIERGCTPGRVRDVIETDVTTAECNVDEPGLMIESAPFGLVFWPTSSSDAAVFVGRAS